jgi:hypothetical protein
VSSSIPRGSTVIAAYYSLILVAQGHPYIGTQREPYYDKDVFVPHEFVPLPTRFVYLDLDNRHGVHLRRSMPHRETRLIANFTAAFLPPEAWALVLALAPVLEPPLLQQQNVFNTSRAVTAHWVRYRAPYSYPAEPDGP